MPRAPYRRLRCDAKRAGRQTAPEIVTVFRSRPNSGGGDGGTTMASQTFDNRPGVIWYNGAFVPWKEATLHVLSHGLHYASAVFEGQRAYGGVVFKLDEHTRRLHESARLLGFEIPYSVEAINKATQELVARQGQPDAYVRPIAWRGSE